MSIKDLTITDQNVQGVLVVNQPDRLTGTAEENKKVFDAFPQLIRKRFNELLEALAGAGAAGEIPIGPIEGVTAENVQQALEAIQQNLTAYINRIKSAVGASEVGVSPIGGIEADNVQAALQALRTIQSAINQNVQTIMSEKGAEKVGVSAISGMTAQNVQQALAELRKAIENIVSGIIPGGSITADMIADGAIVQLGALLAVAAAAAYDPEGSYAVGDYCTYQGLLHKCNTPIPDGEEWNAEHWTETTVAAELAGKANATPPEESALPLLSGVTPTTTHGGYSCAFRKNQFNKVHIDLGVEGDFANNAALFQLPEDCRPEENVAIFAYNGSGYSSFIRIDANGIGSLFFPDSDMTTNLVIASGDFYAAK